MLVSVIGCGIARFDLATADVTTESTALLDGPENADLDSNSPPTVHKSFDALAQHHRTLPHRTRSLTPSRWWHHTHLWPTVAHHRESAGRAVAEKLPTGRMLLTQFCISLR